MLKGNFKNGKEEGAWVGYNNNGQLWSKSSFKNGKLEGDWVYYNKDGTVYRNLPGTYKDGNKISD
jgi:antitoxin component YwqK of YwqJK toxin-antitoxin module